MAYGAWADVRVVLPPRVARRLGGERFINTTIRAPGGRVHGMAYVAGAGRVGLHVVGPMWRVGQYRIRVQGEQHSSSRPGPSRAFVLHLPGEGRCTQRP
ncbi:MAG: hypothetical protein WAV00_23825 [Nocardioides sp.]